MHRPSILSGLAAKAFDSLSDAELVFFNAIAEGKPANLLHEQEGLLTGEKAVRIPADRLAWLCSDAEALKHITAKGIIVHGVHFADDLHLEWLNLSFPLQVTRCVFEGRIFLTGARLRELTLAGSKTKGIEAEGLRVDGSVSLGKDFESSGRIHFQGAQIEGRLNCDGGHFNCGDEEEAFNGDHLYVGAHITFRNGFTANGTVRMVRAKVGRQMSFSGGKFSSQKTRDALKLDGCEVARDIIFDKEAEVAGCLNAPGIKVGGQVIFSECEISGGNGIAMYLDHAEITSGLFFTSKFRANGLVNLFNAVIKGDVDFDGGTFVNPGQGVIDASGCQVSGEIAFGTSFSSQGRVCLDRLDVKSDLTFEGAKFSNPGDVALSLYCAEIGGDLEFKEQFQCQGEVVLNTLSVKGKVGFQNGKIEVKAGTTAVDLGSCSVSHDLFLENSFSVVGNVDCEMAEIKGTLITHAFRWSDASVFNLRYAYARVIWDSRDGWPKPQNLDLCGFRYDEIHPSAPIQAKSRAPWLKLQRGNQFLPQVYEQLAKMYRTAGHDECATRIMILKNREYEDHAPFLRQQWLALLRILVCYGYRPGLAFAISAAFIVFGWLVFNNGYNHGAFVPSDEKAYKEGKDTYPPFNSFIYSTETFLPLIKFDEGEHWRPQGGEGDHYTLPGGIAWNQGDVVRSYFYFHIAIGWFLTSLWLGALTGLIKKP